MTATHIRVATQVEPRPYLVLHFAENFVPTPQPEHKSEHQSGSKLGSNTPVVTVPKPISPTREGHVRSRLELKIMEGREQKIQSLLQKVQSILGANDWIEEFNEYTLDQTEERAISLASFVVEVLNPLRLYDLKALACEILQVLLSEGQVVEEFLLMCQIGLSKRKEFLEKCRRENIVALSHFEACLSFEKKDDAQLRRECHALQERMRALQAYRRQITQEARVQINSLIQRVNSLGVQLDTQAIAIQRQELGETSLHALIAEYRTFLEGLKELK